MVTGIVTFKSHYENKVDEAQKKECEEKIHERYIWTLEHLASYSGTNEMYEKKNRIRGELLALSSDVFDVDIINSETGEPNVGLMHSTKVGDFYIYDDYLKMLLRAYYVVKGEKFYYSYDKIISMNENATEEEVDNFTYLLDDYSDLQNIYLNKVFNAYDKYLEINGEKYAGKEKYQLNYEDCLALEVYFEEESESEETTEADDEQFMYDLFIKSMYQNSDTSE